ncbi:MlaD family protein [Ferrimonas pelagia]|uniref:MlaD family protein n=1 Tax=Ferrimonas pelagia TaxID=1177826 RepID=A0ABP9F813_9GAMM
MTEVHQPQIRRKKNLSPIWILPILAACLGLWLLFSYIQQRGTNIQVDFPSAAGIEANKTLVRYQGIVVGQVTNVKLASDQQSVNVSIKMDHSVDDLLRKGAHFWLVTPKASLTGFEGLDALFSGNYITMAPGTGAKKTHFEGQFEPPVASRMMDGLPLQIIAPQRGSLDIGSAIYFQQVKVGEIVNFQLDQDQHRVIFDAEIESRYRSLVRHNSRFWNTSGAAIDASLQGVKVELESLASLLAGGIAFSSPEDGHPPAPDQSFALYDDAKAAKPQQRITLYADDAEGINVGAGIRYRGVTLGQIEQVNLTEQGVEFNASIDNRYASFLRSETQFSRVSAKLGLDGLEHVETLLLGDFIRIWPGQGDSAERFELLSATPQQLENGRLFTLEHEQLHGVSIGAPIRYRGVTVGEILDVALTDSGVETQIWLDTPHHERVKINSRFWVQAALDIRADLAQLTIQSQPLGQLMAGGLSFSSGDAPVADSAQRFRLAPDRDSAFVAEPLRFTLQAHALNGLGIGAPLLYRELEIGQIERIALEQGELELQLSIDDEYRNLLTPSSRFWHHSGVKIAGSLAGVEVQAGPLPTLLRGGLSFDNLDPNAAPGMPEHTHVFASRNAAMQPGEPIELFLSAQHPIQAGADIRFQGHNVGKTTQVELTDDLKDQRIQAELHRRWADQFRRMDSQFYLVSAQIGLGGIRNPETLLLGNHIAVLPGSEPELATQFNVAATPPVMAPFGDGLRLVLDQQRLGSLHIGSPVLYRQIKVGEVIHTRLAEDGASVDIELQLMPQYQHLANRSSQFWNASGLNIDIGLFSGAEIQSESLETLLSGGIAFATKDTTTSENQLNDGDRLPLNSKLNSAWLKWQPLL